MQEITTRILKTLAAMGAQPTASPAPDGGDVIKINAPRGDAVKRWTATYTTDNGATRHAVRVTGADYTKAYLAAVRELPAGAAVITLEEDGGAW